MASIVVLAMPFATVTSLYLSLRARAGQLSSLPVWQRCSSGSDEAQVANSQHVVKHYHRTKGCEITEHRKVVRYNSRDHNPFVLDQVGLVP
jgi:hypothetical protein